MSNFLGDGVRWLADRLEEHAGEAVLYCRGEKVCQIRRAVPARPSMEIASEEGFDVRARALDWLVSVADLVLDGVRTEPAAGDLVRTTGATPAVYEVAPLTGAACFEVADAYATRWRIHAKLIAGVP